MDATLSGTLSSPRVEARLTADSLTLGRGGARPRRSAGAPRGPSGRSHPDDGRSVRQSSRRQRDGDGRQRPDPSRRGRAPRPAGDPCCCAPGRVAAIRVARRLRDAGRIDGRSAAIGANLGRRRDRRSRARTCRVDGQERRSGSAVRCRAAGLERRRHRPPWFRDGVAFRGPREPSQESADVARGATGEDDGAARHVGNRHRVGGRQGAAYSAARIDRSHHRSRDRGTRRGQAAAPHSARTTQLRWAPANCRGAIPHHAGRVLGRARARRRQRERRDGHTRRPHRGRDRLPSTRHRHTVAGGGAGSRARLVDPRWRSLRDRRQWRRDD